MITGAHAVLFTTDADAARGFFRDVLEFPSVDAGGGWLIFGLPPAELAAHPADENGRHELYLMCDDINATVAELSARGADIPGPVTDEGFGLVTAIRLPVTARLRSSSASSSLGCSGAKTQLGGGANRLRHAVTPTRFQPISRVRGRTEPTLPRYAGSPSTIGGNGARLLGRKP
jgi:catechol 2,3-dioxygenase-like lactoylglutathione lyase family enzyme